MPITEHFHFRLAAFGQHLNVTVRAFFVTLILSLSTQSHGFYDAGQCLIFGGPQLCIEATPGDWTEVVPYSTLSAGSKDSLYVATFDKLNVDSQRTGYEARRSGSAREAFPNSGGYSSNGGVWTATIYGYQPYGYWFFRSDSPGWTAWGNSDITVGQTHACPLPTTDTGMAATSRLASGVRPPYYCLCTSEKSLTKNSWSVTTPSSAQGALRCAPAQPVEETTCSISNPVLPGSGTKLQTETDYVGQGAAGLTIRRFYRSAWRDGTSNSMTPVANAGGWKLSIHSSVTTEVEKREGNLALVLRPDGSTLSFVGTAALPFGGQVAWAPRSGRDRLFELLDAANLRTGWKLEVAADDSVETFNALGQLIGIKQRNGWLTSLNYVAGKVATVRDPFAREIVFAYDAQGRVSTLTAPGNSITHYGYDLNNNLSNVTWPDGNVRRYHYENSNFTHALTGITDEAGTRFATYAYDSLGRVISSEHVGGADRVEFVYGAANDGSPQTMVIDYSGPGRSATTRNYTFKTAGGVMRPTAVTAPCPLCGNTQQASGYNSMGLVTREIAHDGSVTFYGYDLKGREVERATFPSSYQSATARPALSAATRVISTQWHATWNLPVKNAAPGKLSTQTYNSKGMLTGQSFTATTDSTGAAGFGAVKAGSTFATGWSYSANNLATTTVTTETPLGATVSTETGRWTSAFSANGNLNRVVDVKGNNRTATMAQYDADGRFLSGTDDSGNAISLTYTPRGGIAKQTRSGQAVDFTYNAVGDVLKARTPDGQTIDYVYDANQVLVDVKLNGVSITAQMLASQNYPETPLKVRLESAKKWLALGIESLMENAHAQVIFGLGGRASPPTFDPRTDMLMSPIADSEKQLRALQEAFARLCECDPTSGYTKPTFSKASYAHVFFGGHTTAMFPAQSYFNVNNQPGQALVDEVVRLAASQPNSVESDKTRDVYKVFMGRVVGSTLDKSTPPAMVDAQYVRLVVQKNNCDVRGWRANEVVTFFPTLKP